MNVNLTGYLISITCAAALCVLWFFLADRRKAADGKSPLLSLLILVLGISDYMENINEWRRKRAVRRNAGA